MFVLILHWDDDTSWEYTSFTFYSDHNKAHAKLKEEMLNWLDNSKLLGASWLARIVDTEDFSDSEKGFDLESDDYNFSINRDYACYNDNNECNRLALSIVEITKDHYNQWLFIDARV